MSKVFSADANKKNAQVAQLFSDNLDSETKSINRTREIILY